MRYNELQPHKNAALALRKFYETNYRASKPLKESFDDEESIINFCAKHQAVNYTIGERYVACSILFSLLDETILVSANDRSVLVSDQNATFTFANGVTYPITDIPDYVGPVIQATILFDALEEYEQLTVEVRLTFHNYTLKVVDKLF